MIGRPRDKGKDLAEGVASALRLLRQLEHEKEVIRCYRMLPPDKQLQVIFKLREQAYIASKEPETHKPIDINVNIRRIGA